MAGAVSARFPAEQRLRKRHEFLAVQAEGVKHQTRHFTVLSVSRGSHAAAGRLGITVTKRVGSAVTRNRIKRFVREFVRTTHWVPLGCDVVVIAKKSASDLPGLAAVAADLEAARGRLS